jgi:hypothetical protein
MCYVRSARNEAHPVVVRPCGILRESERLDAGEPQRKYPYPPGGDLRQGAPLRSANANRWAFDSDSSLLVTRDFPATL